MKLLFINSCIRGANSKTLLMAQQHIKNMCDSNENLVVTERNLVKENLHYLTEKDFDIEGNKISTKGDNYAKEFAEADEIVIAAPFWEFEFPAVLNCYIEMISKVGITFNYTDRGPVGLCNGNNLTYIYTAGSKLSDIDKIGEKRLERLCKLYGIKNLEVIMEDGFDI